MENDTPQSSSMIFIIVGMRVGTLGNSVGIIIRKNVWVLSKFLKYP